MSEKQPEALRLAKALDSQHATTVWNNSGEAADELRRLHALSEESRTVVRDLLNALPSATTHPAIIAARTLAAKLESEQ